MADFILTRRHPLDGLGLPAHHGAAALETETPGSIVHLAPFAGQGHAVDAALRGLIGCGLPPVGQSQAGDGAVVLWAGLGQWLVLADDPGLPARLAAALAGKAAGCEQSDGWAALRLFGDDAPEVMARLCPLDLHPDAQPQGSVARTEMHHIMTLVWPRADGFFLLVMRSFAGSAVGAIITAMASLAAQRALNSGAKQP